MHVAIVGARRERNLEASLAAADGELSAADVTRVEEIAAPGLSVDGASPAASLQRFQLGYSSAERRLPRSFVTGATRPDGYYLGVPGPSPARLRFRKQVDQTVTVLFALVTEALPRATAALLDQDVNLAQEVIESDQAIDRRCEELTALVKDGLSDAAQDPQELESLVDILQMIPELERSADLAEHIARRTLRGLGGAITPRSRGLIQQMSDLAIEMWDLATGAYKDHSRDACFQLARADDQLDELASSLVAQSAEAASSKIAGDLALIARFYERLGDHAVNLGRRVDALASPRRLAYLHIRPSLRANGSGARGRAGGGLLARVRRMRLVPNDLQFFDLFQSAANNAQEAAEELSKLTASFSDLEEHCERIRALERHGDELTSKTVGLLDTSFITPFDRGDIHALSEKIDDVTDDIFAAASLIQLVGVKEPLPELTQQATVLVNMAGEMTDLFGSMRSGQGARHRLERIEHLEREGDDVFRQAIKRLFSGEYGALDVLKWKDIVQSVEDALNAIEEVSEMVESIMVKNA